MAREKRKTVKAEDLQGECPMGLTWEEIQALLPEEGQQQAFQRWMGGQTIGFCDGQRWNEADSTYEDTECVANPHGAAYYRWDVARFLNGGPIVD